MKLYNILIACILSLSTQSCIISTLDIPDIENNTSYIFMYSVFEAGDTFSVFLQEARSVNVFVPNDTPYINDAVVIIYENEIFYDTLRITQKGQYNGSKIARIGNTYRIEVLHKTFGIAKATAKLENPKIVFNDPLRRNSGTASNGTPLTTWSILFNDNKQERNYYGFNILLRDQFAEVNTCWSSTNAAFQEPKGFSFGNNTQIGDFCDLTVISDNLILDEAVRIQFELNESEVSIFEEIELEFYSFPEVLYQFNRSTRTQDDAAQNGLSFFSQPTIIPTNVEGGLGIFAGFARTRVIQRY